MLILNIPISYKYCGWHQIRVSGVYNTAFLPLTDNR